MQPPCGSDYSLQKDGTRREDGKAVKGAVDDFARRKGRRPPVRKGRLAGATGLLHWPSFGRLALGGATHSLVEHLSSAHSPVVAVGVIAELAPHSTRPRLPPPPRRQLQIAHRDNQRAFMWEAWLMRR